MILGGERKRGQTAGQKEDEERMKEQRNGEKNTVDLYK